MAPNTRLGVLIVHGMGDQETGYSRPMQATLRNLLGRDADRVLFEEVLWAPALRVRADRLHARMQAATGPDDAPLPLRWRKLRHFLVHSFADAVAYNRGRQSTSAYREVHDCVDAGVRRLLERLGTDDAPVVVLAHSLGAHVVSNYVWDTEAPPQGERPAPPPWTPLPGLVSLITFGANVPLFSLAFDLAEPIVLPASGVDGRLADAARWLNFFDADDTLGWPLRALFEPDLARIEPHRRRTVARIEDHALDAGPFPRNLTPLCHEEYWTDPDLLRPTAAHLRELLDILAGEEE